MSAVVGLMGIAALEAEMADRLKAKNDELDCLRTELREANEAIRELQQEACNRAGVPMPSQRPVVERLRAVNAALLEALAAWEAFDNEPFHFEDHRYISLVEQARALTRAAKGETP